MSLSTCSYVSHAPSWLPLALLMLQGKADFWLKRDFQMEDVPEVHSVCNPVAGDGGDGIALMRSGKAFSKYLPAGANGASR